MGRMKDFKRFMSFVGKEFNHILRDTRTLMVLIVMPVVMIVLFGFALSTEIKDVKVAVYDPSRDAATSRLISQIDASEYFTVTAFIDSEEGVLEAFRSNSADIALHRGRLQHQHRLDGGILRQQYSLLLPEGAGAGGGSQPGCCGRLFLFSGSSLSRADTYLHPHDVQSPDEERLQLRARSHGHDSHARVRDDDLGVYRP